MVKKQSPKVEEKKKDKPSGEWQLSLCAHSSKWLYKCCLCVCRKLVTAEAHVECVPVCAVSIAKPEIRLDDMEREIKSSLSLASPVSKLALITSIVVFILAWIVQRYVLQATNIYLRGHVIILFTP